MANTTLSPNMSLPVPTVGTDPGPQYATDVNSCLTLVDGHDHSPGFGVQVTPTGININSSIAFNSHFATTVAGITFAAQSVVPTNGTVYESGVDLYYVDGNGNNVRITNGGSVAGSTGNIAGLAAPASATYLPSSGTFQWQSNTNTPANMDAASYIFRDQTANSFGVTVNAPASLAANYALTLPSIPGATSFLGLDTSGNITPITAFANGITAGNIAARTITSAQIAIGTITATEIAGSTITFAQIAGATILGSNIAASTIGTTNLANGIITTAKIATSAVTQATLANKSVTSSLSCGTFSYAGGGAGEQVISNLAVTQSVTGNRPVLITFQGAVNQASSFVAGAGAPLTLRLRNMSETGTTMATYTIPASFNGPVCVSCWDAPAAGAYDYFVTVQSTAAATITNYIITTYEM